MSVELAINILCALVLAYLAWLDTRDDARKRRYKVPRRVAAVVLFVGAAVSGYVADATARKHADTTVRVEQKTDSLLAIERRPVGESPAAAVSIGESLPSVLRYELGLVYRRSGYVEHAESEFMAAVRRDSTNGVALAALGLTFAEQAASLEQSDRPLAAANWMRAENFYAAALRHPYSLSDEGHATVQRWHASARDNAVALADGK